MTHKRKTVYLSIADLQDLKKLGLLTKSQKRNLRRSISRKNKKKQCTNDDFGGPKSESYMPGYGTTYPLTHTSNISNEIGLQQLKALEQQKDSLNPQLLAIRDELGQQKLRHDNLLTNHLDFQYATRNVVGPLINRFNKLVNNPVNEVNEVDDTIETIPTTGLHNIQSNMMDSSNYSHRFSTANNIAQQADHDIDEVLSGDGGATATQGSDAFEAQGVPTPEVQMANNNIIPANPQQQVVEDEDIYTNENYNYGEQKDNKTSPYFQTPQKIIKKSLFSPQYSGGGLKLNNDENTTKLYDPKDDVSTTGYFNPGEEIQSYLSDDNDDETRSVTDDGLGRNTIAREVIPTVAEDDDEDAFIGIPQVHKGRSELAEEYKSLYGNSYDPILYKNGKKHQFESHIKKYNDITELRTQYLFFGGKKTDSDYKSANKLKLSNGIKKLQKNNKK